MAAMALMSDPDLVIFDEPTTALDVTTQIEVLHAFRRVVRERKTTGVYVTHDLAVVAQMADRILVLRDGAQREIGTTPQIIGQPQDDYTRTLIAAADPKPRFTRGAGRGRDAAAGDSQPPRGLRRAGQAWQARFTGAGRREPAPAPRPGRRRDRRVRLGQDDAGARGGWPGGAGGRAGPVRRQAAAAAGGRAVARGAAPHPDRVPDGGHGAEPAPHDRADPGAAAAAVPGPPWRGAGQAHRAGCSTWCNCRRPAPIACRAASREARSSA